MWFIFLTLSFCNSAVMGNKSDETRLSSTGSSTVSSTGYAGTGYAGLSLPQNGHGPHFSK